MIKAVLDFNEVSNKPYGESKYIPKDKKEELVLLLCEKLSIPLRTGWDAFRDFFWHLRIAEYEEYNPTRDEWKNIEEWKKHKIEDAQYGLKNERGVRDDLLLILVNFRPFYLKHRGLASTFLEVIFEIIQETGELSTYEDGSDILDIQILIKS